MSKLFRKKALDYLSSPEQLDVLMTFSSPGYWLALLALAILIITGVAWSFLGSVPVRVQGTGIIVRQGGIHEVQAHAEGILLAVNVKVGDVVEKGQRLALIRQVETLQQIRKNRNDLAYLQSQAKVMNQLDEEKKGKNLYYLYSVEKDYNDNIKKINTSKDLLDGIVKMYHGLSEKAVVSKVDYINVLQRSLSAQVNLIDAKKQLVDLPYRRYISEYNLRNNVLERELRISQMLQEQKSLLEQHSELAVISSSIYGKVLSISARVAENINPGTPLMTIGLGPEKEIEVIAYLSSTHGKKVKTLMKTEVAPSIVKPQRYGSMVGLVTQIGEYPETERAMLATLNNPALVKELSKGMAPIRADIELIPDPKTPSGYEWTSSKGPPFKILAGNICSVTVTVEERAPITYVIPFLRKYLLGEGVIQKDELTEKR